MVLILLFYQSLMRKAFITMYKNFQKEAISRLCNIHQSFQNKSRSMNQWDFSLLSSHRLLILFILQSCLLRMWFHISPLIDSTIKSPNIAQLTIYPIANHLTPSIISLLENYYLIYCATFASSHYHIAYTHFALPILMQPS